MVILKIKYKINIKLLLNQKKELKNYKTVLKLIMMKHKAKLMFLVLLFMINMRSTILKNIRYITKD